MIETLQHVSDQWLDGRNEMHFSVGQFSEAYLSKAPIGIMRNEEGKIIAFCTLMPTYFNDAISVDLIRWLPELDLPLMDGLYLHMLSWGKKRVIVHLIWGWQHFLMLVNCITHILEND